MSKLKNLNLLFNKLYFQGLRYEEKKVKNGTELVISANESDIESMNRELFDCTFSESDTRKLGIDGVKPLLLQTTYPGLLAGTGYSHDGAPADASIKTGFSFDYVSGQPYIPASSVKGVLRSHFAEHAEAVREIANTLGLSIPDIKALEAEIFDGEDVFFDAVLYCGNEEGKFLGSDYITPHKEAIKAPTPIHMIKILPGVKLEFRFLLKDSSMTADNKLVLFKTLLMLFGIGAKTNVGYGILAETDNSRPIIKERTAPEPDKSKAQYNKKPIHTNGNRVQCSRCRQVVDLYRRDGTKYGTCKCGAPLNYDQHKRMK